MNEIEIMFKDREIKRGGVTLFTKGDAREFIDACATRKVRILGIDGFFLLDEKIEPSMENSLDFTLKSFHGEPYQAARDLLERSEATMFFGIVCG